MDYDFAVVGMAFIATFASLATGRRTDQALTPPQTTSQEQKDPVGGQPSAGVKRSVAERRE